MVFMAVNVLFRIVTAGMSVIGALLLLRESLSRLLGRLPRVTRFPVRRSDGSQPLTRAGSTYSDPRATGISTPVSS